MATSQRLEGRNQYSWLRQRPTNVAVRNYAATSVQFNGNKPSIAVAIPIAIPNPIRILIAYQRIRELID